MYDDSLTIDPPVYLIGMMDLCWRCHARMPVVTILAPNVEGTEGEICILTAIAELPEYLVTYIQGRVPTYKLKFSKTVKSKYYSNTCPKCGILSGDFYLHSEPGAPFFPTEIHEAASLYMTELPVREQIRVRSSLHVGSGELIMNNAKRIV